MQNHANLIPGEKHLYGKSIKQNQGLGKYCLCKECNNKTGSWYGNDYSQFAQAFDSQLRKCDTNVISHSMAVRPLPILKQIICFMLCADQALGSLRAISGLKEFILNKYLTDLPQEIRVFMYATPSSTHRIVGICTIMDFKSMRPINLSEFNYHPFGFVLTLDSPPPIPILAEITHFKTCSYDMVSNVKFDLPVLLIDGPMPGGYANCAVITD